ncbi:MAG: TolC family protein [Planctomycetaceae bacterium]|jgi:outer membrane protein TolC
MQIRLWQLLLTVAVMPGMAGCHSSARVANARAHSTVRTIVSGEQRHPAGDGLTESERIRSGWRVHNDASRRRDLVQASQTPIEPIIIDTQLQPIDSAPTYSADQPVNVLDVIAGPLAGDPESGELAEADAPVILASSEMIAEEPIQPVAAAALVSASEAFPVDLPTILRLAGGHNWAVQLAWERINEAEANVDAAEVLWVPSLNIGVGGTKHEGQIQGTNGQIVDVSRNSLFVGGGAKVANAPLTGGSGGPARLFVDLSIADAMFKPLVARQLSCAARSRHAVEFNNAQLEGTLAYFDLVAAQGEVSTADMNISDAQDLLSMTEAFVTAGKASAAEVSRVQVILANQQQARVSAVLKLKLASSELIRIVRLDPSRLSSDALLFSADDHLMAIELIPESSDLSSLIVQGQRSRPEVAEQYALSQAQRANARSQRLRPYIPHVNLGMSGGGFGGGVGSNLTGLDGRFDADALLVWEIRNLGLGEKAARRESASQYRQTVLSAHQVQDQVAADIRNAWHRVDAGRQRMAIARDNVDEASRVLRSNLERIRGLEGLPLEAIQALNGVSGARLNLLGAIVDYNKAQASLLRAVGRPVSNAL